MRILIVEEALRLGNGHWPRYVADLEAGFRAEGDTVDVLGHREANDKVKAMLPDLQPWLSRDCRADVRSQGLIGGIRHNLCLKRELGGWLKERETYDWILSLSSRPKHLLAFAMLARAGYCAKSRFLLLFVISPGQQDAAGKFRLSASNLFAKFCFALLRAAAQRGQVVIAAETKGMQAEVEKFSGLRTILFPHPVQAAQPPRTDSGGRMADGAEEEILTTKDTNTHERGEERGAGSGEQGDGSFEPHRGGWAAARETAARQPEGRDERERTSQITQIDTDRSRDAGPCLDKPSGDAFSNPFTSELARDSESTSLTRSASGPALARIAPEDRRLQIEARGELVHKSSGGEGSGSTSPIEESSGAGAKPELPICEQSYSKIAEGSKLVTSSAMGKALGTGLSALDTPARPAFVVAPGLARYEKGSDILQEAIKLILSNKVASEEWRVASVKENSKLLMRGFLQATAAGRPVRFVMQWPEDFHLPDGRRCGPDPDLLQDGRMEFSRDLLTGDSYWDFLQRADVVVLPYRSESYRARVSRVAIEAAMLGKPMVYNRNTWIHEVAGLAGGGIAVEEESPRALAHALETAIIHLEKLCSLAELGATRVRRFFTVSSFRDLLCGDISVHKKRIHEKFYL